MMPQETPVDYLKRMVFPYLTHDQKMIVGGFFYEAKQYEEKLIVKAWNDGDHAYFCSKYEDRQDFATGQDYYNEVFQNMKISQ